MLCHIIRPFDIVSRFWTYRITINEQEFLFRGIGTKSVDVEPNDSYRINVSTSNFYSPSSSKNSCTLTNGCTIVISSFFTNWMFLLSLFVGISMILIGWLVLDSVLFICTATLVYLLFSLFFFNVKRKSFFRIAIER